LCCQSADSKFIYRENASEVLEEYYEKIGGREKVFESTKKALQTKKRARQSNGAASGAKRAKVNGNHPLDSEPPASARAAAWKPPAGSWDDHIEMLDAMEDEAKETLVVYLTWKNGQKTQHPLPVIYKRAPQKVGERQLLDLIGFVNADLQQMLQFYERHVRIIKKDSAST
jgi:chromobox protein 1